MRNNKFALEMKKIVRTEGKTLQEARDVLLVKYCSNGKAFKRIIEDTYFNLEFAC